MNSFLTRISRTAIAAAALLVLGTHALVAEELPFTGAYVTHHDDAFVWEEGRPAISVDVTGAGWAAWFGESTCETVYQFMFMDDGSGKAKYILRGRGCDTLILDLVALPTEHGVIPPDQIVFGGTFTVTGTGRYRDVTGSGSFNGYAQFEAGLGVLPNAGVGGWTFCGVIDLPPRKHHRK